MLHFNFLKINNLHWRREKQGSEVPSRPGNVRGTRPWLLKLTCLSVVGFFLYFLFVVSVEARQDGTQIPFDLGVRSEMSCSASFCHGTTGGSFNAGGSVVFNNLPESFVPGATYSSSITITDGQAYGFQLASLFSDDTQAGTLTPISANTVSDTKDGIQFLVHSSPLSTGMVDFQWTAPLDPKENSVVLKVASNSANGNFAPTGDQINTLQVIIPQLENRELTYLISLEEGQEVPPTGSMATGVCTGVLNADQTEFTVVCTHDVADATAAHIHNGPTGENGPVIFPFDSATSPIIGTAPVDIDLLANLQTGNLYVNVHSSAFPGGEIRSQILGAAPLSAVLPLEEGQEVPPTGSMATGECVAAMKEDRTELTVSCTHDVANATGAHIHNGPAGENGPVIFPFDSATSPIIGTAPVDTDLLENLISGNLYVNVHSDAFPPGEIRGQIPNLFDTVYFAQFGNGEGFFSDIVLTSASATRTVSGRVDFTDGDGAELSVGLVGEQAQTGLEFSIAPLGSLTISTDGAGDLLAGSARVTADNALGGVVRFSIPDIGIGGVGESSPLGAAIVPARSQAGIRTAVAIRDAGNRDNVVNLTLRDSQGQAVENGTATLMISPRGRISQFIDELFPDANLEDFQGTLEIRPEGGRVAVIALELGMLPGEFTTLPVTPLQ